MGSSLAVSSRMRIGFQTGPMFNRYRTGSIRAVTIEAPLTHRSVPDDLLELEAQRRALAARYTDSPAPYIWTWIAYVEFAIGK